MITSSGDYKHLTLEIASAQERGRLQNKIHKQEKLPVPRCIALSTKLLYNCLLQVYNPGDLDYEEVGSRRHGERSENMIQSFLCFFDCSLFSCSKTTVMATWNARG
jgi:hypothetical protein